MGNQAPGSEKGSQQPSTQGTPSPGSQDRTTHSQHEQAGKQGQQGGLQRPDKPHDSDPGRMTDKESDRSKSGAQRPE